MKKTTAGILVVAVLAALVAWYLNARKPVEGHPSVVAAPALERMAEPVKPKIEHPIEAIEPQVEAAPEPLAEPEPEPLPALVASDSLMVETLNGLLANDALLGLFLTDQFVNRVVATVDSLPGRQVAPLVVPVRAPVGKFLVIGEEEPFTISPENDARYSPYIEIATVLDVDAVVSAYVRYYPLFQEAYEALGYPGAYFNDRLVEVIDHLLQTPEPDGVPYLEKYEAVYVYQDAQLESLSAGQKTLLRIGADNRRVLLDQLRQYRQAVTRDWDDREVTR